MGKKINAEKVLPLLMYPDNLSFLQHEAKLPHSSSEIMNNLRTQMGGTIAFEQNPMQGIAIYVALLVICLIAWVIAGGLTLESLRFFTSSNLIPPPRAWLGFGAIVASVCAVLVSITWLVSKTLFSALRYSPAKMKKSYALMLHQGKPIKGALVSAESVNGVQIITYRFTSPDGDDLTNTYRTPRHKYKKGEVVSGKGALVLYLDDTINTLL